MAFLLFLYFYKHKVNGNIIVLSLFVFLMTLAPLFGKDHTMSLSLESNCLSSPMVVTS